MRKAAALCAMLLGSCSSPPAPTSTPAPAPETAVADSGFGAACKFDPDDKQSDCPDGFLCGPAPGGYCTKPCGNGDVCGPGGVCVGTTRGGEFCFAACESDADCRTDQGYYCDARLKGCGHPAVMSALAPPPPRCEGAPLAKRTFGPAAQVTTPAGGSVSDQELDAAVDGDGDLHIAYIARDTLPRPNPLGLAVVEAGGAIRGDLRLTDSRDNHFDPWMARDRSGRLYLVWLGYDGGATPEKRMQIGLSIRDSAAGATWSATVAAHDPADCPDERPGCLDKPMIAIGPDRDDPKRDAIYISYAAEGNKVVKSVDGGETFSPGVQASEQSYGDLVVDRRGVVHMVNATVSPRGRGALGDEDGYVEYVYSDDGGESFSAPIHASAPAHPVPGLFVNPQVESDADRGVIYVAYVTGQPDLRWDIALAVSRDRGATWTHHRVNDDAPCALHMIPNMALDPATGRVHLMWVDNRGGAGQVAYTSCDASGCAPNERVSDAPFADIGVVRHSTKWLGEYNALVVDPQRRVLHAVWAQPVIEEVKGNATPRARVFYARAALP